MDISSEITEKENRIRNLLIRLNYDSVLLTRRENFSWMSCGGRSVTSYVIQSSPVYLLITPVNKYAIGYIMDIPRTMDEELANQGYEPICLPAFGKSPLKAAIDLAKGKLAGDDDFTGLNNIEKDILTIHEPFTPNEIERYRLISRESSEILRELADWVEPGMVERHVFAHMWELYLDHNFDGDCMFIGSDDRIRQYRHTVPGYKKIEKVVILAPAVFKSGLHVQVSRTVSFGKPGDETHRRFNDMAFLQAVMLAHTKPGVKINSLLNLCLNYLDQLGYPEEKNNHVHGGPTGYRVSYPERSQDPNEIVRSGMVFTWYLCNSGGKNEEMILVNDKEAEIISVSNNWPLVDIDYDGKKIAIPDMLIK
jgi:Xaa-Pro aminopeptidase